MTIKPLIAYGDIDNQMAKIKTQSYQEEQSRPVSIDVTLKIPKGYFEVGTAMAVFNGNNDFDEFVSTMLIESMNTLFCDGEIFNDQVQAKLGKQSLDN